MIQTTRLWWIRHAIVTETEGTVYGQSDVSCDCSDTPQMRWLADTLPKDAVVITSALKRTHQTAAAVEAAGFGGRRTASHPELNEQCFGAGEGLNYNEIRARYGGSSQQFWLSPAGRRPESAPDRQGESFFDLTQRTHQALERMVRDHAGQDIAVFAHGGTIRAALAIAMGLYNPDNPDILSLIFSFRVDNLSLSCIDHTSYTTKDGTPDQYWRIRLFNSLKAT